MQIPSDSKQHKAQLEIANMTQAGNNADPNSVFEAMAPAYERWAEPVSAEVAEVAIERAGLTKDMRVLDIGAGTGNLAVPASAKGCRVVAIDNTPAMVRCLQARLAPFPQSRAEAMDMRALTFEPASFDAVFSIFCAAFMDDAEAIFAQIVRLAKPGGSVCIVNWTTEFGAPMFELLARALRALPARQDLATSPGLDRLLTVHELKEALLGAGCSNVSVDPVEVSCRLPAPPVFLEELDTFFRVVPAYNHLTQTKKASLQELIEREFENVPIVDGVHTLRAVAHLAVGTVK